MHLDRLVDDAAGDLRDHRLHHRHPDARFLVAQHVHRLRRLQHHQAHLLDVVAGARDDFRVLAQLDQRLAERLARQAALDHHLQRRLRLADRAHAVVDAARPEADLRNLEAAAFAQQDVLLRHAHIGELDVHVAARRMVGAEHMHRADHLHAGRVHRHQDLRLLQMRRRIRARLDHGDHDLAARIARVGDVVFLAVDHPLIALEHGGGRDVLGVRRGHIRLRHRIGRPDLAIQQRLQPRLLLLGRADALQHLHVAGIRRRAVQRFGGKVILAEFGGDIGVVEIGKSLAGLGVGQEEVPQARGLGLSLRAIQQFELARMPRPAIGLLVVERVELLEDRSDVFDDVPFHFLIERTALFRHAQVVELAHVFFVHHPVVSSFSSAHLIACTTKRQMQTGPALRAGPAASRLGRSVTAQVRQAPPVRTWSRANSRHTPTGRAAAGSPVKLRCSAS